MFLKSKVFRFAAVGVVNTAIDFIVTNLMFLAVGIYTPLFLLLYGITGFCAASFNSYILNKHWTFKRSSSWIEYEEGKRFIMVSIIGFIIHSSMMMSSLYVLNEYFDYSYFFMMNFSKIFAVAVSFTYNFLGYRLFTFQNPDSHLNEEEYTFNVTDSQSLGLSISILVLITTALRLFYLQLTTYISGDAVNYAWVAEHLALSQPQEFNPFWYSLFCLWESLFYALGLSRVHATILSSLIPGILIPLPIFFAAYEMFGKRCALFAGMITAFHPRFIEYSCNGYAESFYLLAFFSGIYFLLYCVRHERLIYAFWSGVCFGIYFCVRPEALVPSSLALFSLLYYFGLNYKGGKSVLYSLLGILCVVTAYSTVSYALIQQVPLVQKGSNLFKTHTEQVDPFLAAKETYGAAKGNEPKDLLIIVEILALRYPKNLEYLLTRLPTVLLSPLFIFALLFPMLKHKIKNSRSGHTILLIPLIFPIVFYPLIQLEPRLLFPVLMPIHIYGSAGLLVIGWMLSKRVPALNWPACLTAMLLLLFLSITLFRGIDFEKRYAAHRKVAQWIQKNIPEQELVVGSGYGMINTTGFLTSHPYETHYWAPNPKALIEEEKKRGTKWLVIYEYFLRKYNPELLPLLNEQSTYAQKQFVSDVDKHNKVVIFKLN